MQFADLEWEQKKDRKRTQIYFSPKLNAHCIFYWYPDNTITVITLDEDIRMELIELQCWLQGQEIRLDP